MKDNKTKRAFIEARAEGKSYAVIQKELGIAKATCSQWEKELKEDITTLKDAQREEVHIAYKMQRDARIEAHKAILDRLDNAIGKIDFDDLSPRELLNLRLQYARALKEEYTEPIEIVQDDTLQGILAQYAILFNEAGRISPADLKARLEVLKAKASTLNDLGVIIANETSPFNITHEGEISYADVVLRGETIEA